MLAVLAYLPYVPVELPGLLPGRVNGPGTLQLLATCLVIAGIALSYDVSSAGPACSASGTRSSSPPAATC